MATRREPLILPHGGYQKLKTFQIARLIYDLTVHFCDHFIDQRSRTHDQIAATLEQEGGFTERLYRIRTTHRK